MANYDNYDWINSSLEDADDGIAISSERDLRLLNDKFLVIEDQPTAPPPFTWDEIIQLFHLVNAVVNGTPCLYNNAGANETSELNWSTGSYNEYDDRPDGYTRYGDDRFKRLWPSGLNNIKRINQKLFSLLKQGTFPKPFKGGEIRYLFDLTNRLLGNTNPLSDPLYEDIDLFNIARTQSEIPHNRAEAEVIAQELIRYEAEYHSDLLKRHTKRLLDRIYEKQPLDQSHHTSAGQPKNTTRESRHIVSSSKLTTTDNAPEPTGTQKKIKPGRLFE